MNFQVFPHLPNDVRQEVEGDGGTVKLATTVVGENDSFNTGFGKLFGILNCLNAFDQHFSWPLLLDPLQVVIGHRGVKHVVQ